MSDRILINAVSGPVAKSGFLRSAIIANAIFCSITFNGQANAQDSGVNTDKAQSPSLIAQSQRAKLPQASRARSAYADSLSSTLPSFEKDDDDKKKVTKTLPITSVPGEPTLKIGDIDFIGNSAFSKQALNSLIKNYIGKDLSFNQIKSLASTIEDYYHSYGFQVAKVVIPKQNMTQGGILIIQILEGILGEVRVTGQKRFSADRVTKTFYEFNEKGKPFTLIELERPLVLMNSYSGLSVSSTLSKGDTLGSTNVDITVKEERLLSGSIEMNNFGSKDSGEYRIIPNIVFQNLSGVGDELNFFGVISPDSMSSWYWQGSYARPINLKGSSINAYFGRGNNQVGNDYAILDIKGENLSWGAGFTHKVIYSAKTSLELLAWFEWQDMDQRMLGYTTSDDRIRKLRVGANFDHTDSSGRTMLSANIHQGLGEVMDGMNNNDSYSSRAYAQADNGFTKITLAIMRMQNISPRFYALFNIMGQYSPDTLVASEQIYSGGANSVRGQPQSCFSGDDGILINGELRYAVFADVSLLQLAAFIDHGQTYLKRPVIGQKSSQFLSGAGLGIRSRIAESINLRCDVAVPLGRQYGNSCYVYGQMSYSF